MPQPTEYANDPVAAAVRDPDLGHSDAHCEHERARSDGRRVRCGLPAWNGATEAEPRCEFHSENKPADIAERLVRCVALGADLEGALLDGTHLPGANLARARLSGARLPEADLSGARLHGADLTHAHLDAASLAGAQLARAHLSHASLVRARLAGARLWRANLGAAHLTDSDLKGANLHDADLAGTQLTRADLRGANLAGAVLGLRWKSERERATDLRGADLRGAALDGVVLAPECLLDGVLLGRDGDSDPEPRVAGDHAGVYRQLKLAFQHAGDYERAGIFYYWERWALARALRREAREAIAAMPGALRGRSLPRAARRCARSTIRYVVDWLIDRLCGYGERPLRVAAAASALVLVSALIQWRIGLRVEAGRAYSFWTALYHSVVTLTTLGYGDIAPSPGLGRLVAGVEALLGGALMSLFVVCVVRKFSR